MSTGRTAERWQQRMKELKLISDIVLRNITKLSGSDPTADGNQGLSICELLGRAVNSDLRPGIGPYLIPGCQHSFSSFERIRRNSDAILPQVHIGEVKQDAVDTNK